jgi:CBS domain-containing protein
VVAHKPHEPTWWKRAGRSCEASFHDALSFSWDFEEVTMKVADLMTRSVSHVRADEPLSAAAKLMWDCDCGALPVLDASGRVVGMITDRDICMATWTQNRAPASISVSDAMSRQLHFCSPDQTLALAEELMRSKQIRRIPVLDSNQCLEGILSLADIARRTERASGPASRELAPDGIASTLARICQPPQNASASPALRANRA